MSEETGFRSLRVWRLSHDLAGSIHKMSRSLPKWELFEEGNLIRRASKRISASIVEGYALRKYKAEYLHYLWRAYGSAEETIEHLDYLRETDSLKDSATYEALRAECLTLNRQLFRFIQGVEREHQKPLSIAESAQEYEE